MSFYISFEEFFKQQEEIECNCNYCHGEGCFYMDEHGGWLPQGETIKCEECNETGKKLRKLNIQDYMKSMVELMLEKASYQNTSVFEEACNLFKFANKQGIEYVESEYKGLDYKP